MSSLYIEEEFNAQNKEPEQRSVSRPYEKTMPKWHASWESLAFEAIAKKKALILSPPEIYAEITHLGYEKAQYPWYKVLALSIVAGGYVGLGAATCFLIGGMMNQAPWFPDVEQHNYGLFKLVFGAVGFPFSFATIIVCGSELFTSQCAYTTCAWLERQIPLTKVIKMLVITWCGNFAGCVAIAYLFHVGEVFDHKDMYLQHVFHDKLNLTWSVIIVKGIFANWLVGIATWMANAALDMSGKAIAIWLPISAFAAIGFEHCVANMFILVMAITQGGDATFKQVIWHNLVPATIGNYIGGAFFIAAVYSFIYGKPCLELTKDRFF